MAGKPPAHAAAPGPSVELREPATAPAWSSASGLGKSEPAGRPANCTAQSVTLGDGGIKAC